MEITAYEVQSEHQGSFGPGMFRLEFKSTETVSQGLKHSRTFVLFAALFHSEGLVEFNSPCCPTDTFHLSLPALSRQKRQAGEQAEEQRCRGGWGLRQHFSLIMLLKSFATHRLKNKMKHKVKQITLSKKKEKKKATQN